jgi:hypothetical protein
VDASAFIGIYRWLTPNFSESDLTGVDPDPLLERCLIKSPTWTSGNGAQTEEISQHHLVHGVASTRAKEVSRNKSRM